MAGRRGASAAARARPASGRGRGDGRPARDGHRHVADIQRARMLAAMAQAACEDGAAHATVAAVVRRAGVSRRTFYELFGDAHDCLLAALEDGLAQARERVLGAYLHARGGWRGQVRAALAELLLYFDERPDMARLLVVEWLAAGSDALALRRQALDRIAEVIQRGGGAAGRDPGASRLVAEGVAGSVAAVLHARLSGPRPRGRLAELTSPLMSMIVLPYLGAAAARRELERPAPGANTAQGDAHMGPSPLGGLKMRLTYRTLRVLAALAANPGASNRSIGQAAGMTDQGQVSKLLRRLQKLGLVDNASAGPGGGPQMGRPNAWRLTQRGEEVERSVRIGD